MGAGRPAGLLRSKALDHLMLSYESALLCRWWRPQWQTNWKPCFVPTMPGQQP